MNQKVLPKLLEKSVEQTKKEKEFNELLIQKFNSEPFQKYFQTHDPTLKALFEYLLKNTYTPLNQLNLKGVRDTLPLKALLGFVNDFEVSPLLISFNEVITTYNNMIKVKPLDPNEAIGINFKEFQEILFRAASKSILYKNSYNFLKRSSHLE